MLKRTSVKPVKVAKAAAKEKSPAPKKDLDDDEDDLKPEVLLKLDKSGPKGAQLDAFDDIDEDEEKDERRTYLAPGGSARSAACRTLS